ncbi:mandelate racemase [Rhodobacteraceae bacterium 2CG4]|uniref:Mandelate racemase n=1 Tax=Halovulum marinum TaxID=2662447 RepID=A0A6L5YXB3_9RHOB|nr:enolase C-terminal domain-like protein [Halovulum marinum]MSU88838.1 mandelate racemase [Halovulum marinum]
MTDSPTLTLEEVAFFERDTPFRMPFRFGVVTLTAAPQIFVHARIRTGDGREGWGIAAEMLAPKWFDKSPGLSNEDNFDQLRHALAIAAKTCSAQRTAQSAFGLHAACAAEHAEHCAMASLPPLVASFGTALLDRAILDALLRLHDASVFAGARGNIFGLDGRLTPELDGFDLEAFLRARQPAASIALRHTVGMVDPITAADVTEETRVGDGLPETLEQVIDEYGVTHFKLKVGGDLEADIDRLSRIAAVLDRLPAYAATLDGNEQYADVEGILALWRRIGETPALRRLHASVLFIEQPIGRAVALSSDISPLARVKPVEIDESDGSLDAFVEARRLGYTGVSSKSCKGFYRSLLNRARCAHWNDTEGTDRYFMSAEDLTTQAGIAVQQDLALVALIGCTHVERNGHHYMHGFAGASAAEQDGFLQAHPDLYHRPGDTVVLNIRDGALTLGSLDTPGLGSAAMPDFLALTARHLTA